MTVQKTILTAGVLAFMLGTGNGGPASAGDDGGCQTATPEHAPRKRQALPAQRGLRRKPASQCQDPTDV